MRRVITLATTYTIILFFQGVSFDPTHVLTQLQHLRVLDVALIQSCGYPIRMSHDKFMTSYSSLLISEDTTQLPRDTCRALVEAAQLEDCVVGSHQVSLNDIIWHHSTPTASMQLMWQSYSNIVTLSCPVQLPNLLNYIYVPASYDHIMLDQVFL